MNTPETNIDLKEQETPTKTQALERMNLDCPINSEDYSGLPYECIHIRISNQLAQILAVLEEVSQ